MKHYLRRFNFIQDDIFQELIFEKLFSNQNQKHIVILYKADN